MLREWAWLSSSQFDPNDPTVQDEDGKDHSSLDTAIRAVADRIMKITPMPGLRVPKPPRHEGYDLSVETAFQLGRWGLSGIMTRPCPARLRQSAQRLGRMHSLPSIDAP